ncbi:MAG: hypothetical protein IPJ77_14665 [Planctomycetes bacterium]|nr:hypothetical protein [Planctomycetota bacterium]
MGSKRRTTRTARERASCRRTTTTTGSSTRTPRTTSTATDRSCRCASSSPVRAPIARIPTSRACSYRCRRTTSDGAATGSSSARKAPTTTATAASTRTTRAATTNRAWPSSWAPEHVQFGAGPYPLYWPEPRAIASFIQAHPNIAAVQSFHNAGGMILRGPGTESFGEYPNEDVRVYDELGRTGEAMLPFYKYMVIWKDLYTVWGGFVNWTYEGLGIVSFTNELWNDDQYFQSAPKPVEGGEKERRWFDDKLLQRAGFVDWHPYEHPLYGKVELGGYRKDVGRVPPTFLIEEMLHRNALFCLEHAKAMPKVVLGEVVVTELGDGVKAIDLIARNLHAIPTRTAMAARAKTGVPDTFTLQGKGLTVLAGGVRSDRFRPERIELQEKNPERLLRERGVGSRGELRLRWLVRGKADKAVVTYEGEKARKVELEIKL